MIDFINVLKLIDLIENVFSISKMKLVDFVVLWSNFIESSKRFNVSYWSNFAFDLIETFVSMKMFLNSMFS